MERTAEKQECPTHLCNSGGSVPSTAARSGVAVAVVLVASSESREAWGGGCCIVVPPLTSVATERVVVELTTEDMMKAWRCKWEVREVSVPGVGEDSDPQSSVYELLRPLSG